MAKKLAVILIRGLIGVNEDVKYTLKLLNLKNKHNCVIVEDTPHIRGMLQKIKDYTTFGEVTEESIKLLDSLKTTKDQKTIKLQPPLGGFERKGIKKTFKEKGALGNRGEHINKLIEKMARRD